MESEGPAPLGGPVETDTAGLVSLTFFRDEGSGFLCETFHIKRGQHTRVHSAPLCRWVHTRLCARVRCVRALAGVTGDIWSRRCGGPGAACRGGLGPGPHLAVVWSGRARLPPGGWRDGLVLGWVRGLGERGRSTHLAQLRAGL